MKLSTKGRYAVMAVVDLAIHGQERPVSLADISQRQDISLSYLEQLFAKMKAGGIVTSVRGPGGGYRLAAAANDIRIADIVLAVDETLTQTRCSEGVLDGCSGKGARCQTHDLWDELGRQIYLYLSFVTLEDVVERRIIRTSLEGRPTEFVREEANHGQAVEEQAV